MSPPDRIARTTPGALALALAYATLASCGRAPPAPVRPSATAASSVATATTPVPVVRCTLASEPVVVGRRGALRAGFAVARASTDTAAGAARFSLAWAVTPSEGRCDDTALVELNADGAITRTVDAEDPLATCDGTRAIEHLCTAFPRDEAQLVTDYDALLPAARSTRCGSFAFSYPRRSPGAAASSAPTLADETPSAAYACRTLGGAPARALALRPTVAAGSGRVTEVQLVAVRGAEVHSGAPIARLPVDTARVASAPSPRTELHESHGLDGFDAASLADGGFAYAFRYRQRLYVGALDASLAPRGELFEVPTLASRPGKPRLALASTRPDARVLLLFADAPLGGRYTLRGALFSPGAAVPVPTALETDETNTAHEFAPSASPLGDESWVVTWTQGPLEVERSSTEVQRVRVRHFGADLRPLELPLFVNAIETGSDARVLTAGDRFLLAAFSGRGSTRQVVTVAGRCAR